MRNKFYIAILVLILAGVYWCWWLPGVRVASDFPAVPEQVLKSLFDFPRTWSDRGSEGMGEVSAFFLWSYPLTFISSVFANLGFNFAQIERLVIMIPFLLIGSLSMWKLGENLKLSNPARLISAIFYSANTYVLLLVDGGQFSIALAFAFFPLSFLAWEKAKEGGIKEKIWAGVTTAILGFFDFRFIYLLAVILAIKFFYEILFFNFKGFKKWIMAWVNTVTAVGIIVFGLNVYWLLPLVMSPISPETYKFFTQTSFESLGSLGHALLLLSPHWQENIFGKITPLRLEFIVIPAFALLATILKPKNKTVLFWFFVLILSIFLSKGATEPFGKVYPWFFNHLPGFSLFRDSSKFLTLTALSYALLWGIVTDGLLNKLKRTEIRILLLSLLVFYLLFLIRPVWTGQMTGTFSNPRFQEEFTHLKDLLQSDKLSSRVFWIPSLPPLGYFDSQHPAVEASRLVQKRPFAAGTLGTYEIFNFLREAPYMGEIFDVAGIGYIAYPLLDPKRDNLHTDNLKYYDIFQGQLSNLPWLSKVGSFTIPLWQTKKHQEIFFETADVWWVVGSDNIYNEATKSAKLSLSKNALIFAEEKAGLGKNLDQIPEAKIVLNNKTLLDLAASLINPYNLIFPAQKLQNNPDFSGWWKRETVDLIKWRYFLRDKYQIDNLDFDLGGGWAVAEKSLKLKVESEKLKNKHILLARVLESTRSGELKFYQDNQLIGNVNTQKKENNVRWFEVGQLIKDQELIIASEGDINVINALAVLDKDQWGNYKNKADKLRSRFMEFKKENTSTISAVVSYERINPTKYLVTISNLKEPVFLVFSESYNKLWKINDMSPLPVYSLLNGFRIEKEGEYAVEFQPQKYVLPGMVISVLTLLTAIIVLCLKTLFVRRPLNSRKLPL